MASPFPPQKRKAHTQPNQSSKHTAKRAKTFNARSILTQTSDKALNQNGEVDVSAFVKAREFEIKAMGRSMVASKKALSARAFQQVPAALRRRTASHNVKRVPKRLRGRAAREMKEDNTPTITARRRKLTPHMRLRLEKAKKLKQMGALTKKKREQKKQKPGETDPQKMVSVAPRLPNANKDTLAKPARPPAKFRKRQIHKSWLPTHLYHAKRAHMTEPKDPLWRFAIPTTPTEKCYRTTHRAAAMRGCVAWDMSYMSTIGLEGVELSLLGLLRSVGVEERALAGKRGAKWTRGTRSWDGWIRERDREKRWIAPVRIVWRTSDEHDLDNKRDERAGKKSKRKMLLQVHPSAFLQTWNEILKVAKIQRPPATVEDLRFEIGTIDITGPGSTEALVAILKPIAATEPEGRTPRNPSTQTTTDASTETQAEDDWEDVDTPEKVWPQLAAVTNPSILPANALLAFNIIDPRLQHPPRTVQLPKSSAADDTLLEVLSSWPLDRTQSPHSIFSRTARLTASRLLSSQKAINRRKSDALPGSYPEPSPKDPKIPILLLASRASTTTNQGTWTLLLPCDCVLPVWYSLMHYPLSTGGNPRFGGLQEKRQLSFEHDTPWFPGDFPGTKAGWDWEEREREVRKKEWEKRPKGKRVEWGSVDLGEGRKGEVGRGWACDWERLFEGPPAASADDAEKNTPKEPRKEPSKKTHRGSGITPTTDNQSQIEQLSISEPTEPPPPPLGIQHLPHALAKSTASILPNALTPIHLALLTAGHPTTCARVYRLPTTNPALHARWLTLANSKGTNTSKSNKNNRSSIRDRVSTGTSENQHSHLQAPQLASSLLPERSDSTATDSADRVIKPGDTLYPPVPNEIDLIGFVTSANYHLGSGKCVAIGNIAIAKVLKAGKAGVKGKRGEERLCIIREAGQGLGRLARWRFI